MKKAKRSIAVLGLVSLFICIGFFTLSAQPAKRFAKDCPMGIELSDQQKKQMKEVRIEFAKATRDLNNELNELRARQKTLMSDEKANVEAIYTNIDKVSALKNQLMKKRVSMKLDMQSFLSDEQKILMANRPARKQGMRSGGKGKMSNRPGRNQGASMYNNDGFGREEAFGYSEMNKGMQNNNWMDFSDEQKEQMEELRLAHLKNAKELRDEAEELSLKQKHMMTSGNPDEKLIMENIDRLSEIQSKLEKMRVDHQMEVRKILTEDQLTLFLSRPGMGKGFGRGYRSFYN